MRRESSHRWPQTDHTACRVWEHRSDPGRNSGRAHGFRGAREPSPRNLPPRRSRGQHREKDFNQGIRPFGTLPLIFGRPKLGPYCGGMGWDRTGICPNSVHAIALRIIHFSDYGIYQYIDERRLIMLSLIPAKRIKIPTTCDILRNTSLDQMLMV